MKKTMLTLCFVSLLLMKPEAQTLNTDSSEKTENLEKKQLSPEERAKKDAERAEKKLGLTEAQKTKWELAALERARANAALKEKMKGCTTPDERKEIHKQRHLNKAHFNTTVTAMLTPDQIAKYELEKKKHKDKHGRNQGGKRGVEIPHERNNAR